MVRYRRGDWSRRSVSKLRGCCFGGNEEEGMLLDLRSTLGSIASLISMLMLDADADDRRTKKRISQPSSDTILL